MPPAGIDIDIERQPDKGNDVFQLRLVALFCHARSGFGRASSSGAKFGYTRKNQRAIAVDPAVNRRNTWYSNIKQRLDPRLKALRG